MLMPWPSRQSILISECSFRCHSTLSLSKSPFSVQMPNLCFLLLPGKVYSQYLTLEEYNFMAIFVKRNSRSTFLWVFILVAAFLIALIAYGYGSAVTSNYLGLLFSSLFEQFIKLWSCRGMETCFMYCRINIQVSNKAIISMFCSTHSVDPIWKRRVF